MALPTALKMQPRRMILLRPYLSAYFADRGRPRRHPVPGKAVRTEISVEVRNGEPSGPVLWENWRMKGVMARVPPPTAAS
jgi:hypothetical protein